MKEALNPLGQTKTHFKQLDGLRCIAVMAVLICHWIHYRFVVLTPLGSMGVNLFFVLSGFLITRILLLSKDENKDIGMVSPIKRFYLRRILRIFPIYYLTVLFLFVINFPAARENIVSLLTYTFNVNATWKPVGFLIHLWSLSVEEQFYILFPLFIFLIPKTKMKSFFYSMIIIGVTSRLILHILSAPDPSQYMLTPCCLDAFGIGSILAYYVLYDLAFLEIILKKNYLFLIAVALFIMDSIYIRLYVKNYYEGGTILERFLFSICCFWVVGKAILALYTGIVRKFLENKIIVFIGKISYGIYIYHLLVFPVLVNYLDPFLTEHLHIDNKYFLNPGFAQNNMLPTALLLFIITIAVSSLSWYLIERPINKLKELLH